MKKLETFKIISNESIAKDIYKIILEGETSWLTNPGQFINITIEGYYLKRPISICDWTENSLTLIYKVVGHGTKWLSEKEADETIEALVGLGNGFKVDKEHTLLIGGGVGVPPLYGACKALNKLGIKPTVILGFTKADDVFYVDEFRKIANVYVSTNDGSVETKGFVTNVMVKENLCDIPYMTCGPLVMEKAVYKTSHAHGLISLEERMGCGFGACMGCSLETKEGPRRVCKDGPVFESEVLEWEG